MDLALLSQVSARQEVVLHSAGRWPGIDDPRAMAVPIEDTFCNRLLSGEIDNIVPDVAAEPSVRDLEVARRMGVRSYIGVPMEGSGPELYVLCCLARETHPELGKREVRVLEGFVQSLLDQLEAPARE